MIIFMKDHETCFSISVHQAASLMKRLPGGALIGSPLLQICTDVLFLRQRRRTFFYGCITGGSCRRRIGRPFFGGAEDNICSSFNFFPCFPCKFHRNYKDEPAKVCYNSRVVQKRHISASKKGPRTRAPVINVRGEHSLWPGKKITDMKA